MTTARGGGLYLVLKGTMGFFLFNRTNLSEPVQLPFLSSPTILHTFLFNPHLNPRGSHSNHETINAVPNTASLIAHIFETALWITSPLNSP